jgi:hypothetical protein
MFCDGTYFYNLVNRTKLVHNFLTHVLLFSTRFGQLCAHHQEKIPYLGDTLYLSLYTDDCLVCRAEFIHMYMYIYIYVCVCKTSTVFGKKLFFLVTYSSFTHP